MKSQLTIEELAQGYNLGNLSPEELAVAEWKLANEPAFTEAVEMDAMVNEVVFGNALADVRQQITSDLVRLEQVRKNNIKLGIALGIVLVGTVLSIGYWNANKKVKQPQPQKVIEQPKETAVEKVVPTVEQAMVTPTEKTTNHKTQIAAPTTALVEQVNSVSEKTEEVLVDTVRAAKKMVEVEELPEQPKKAQPIVAPEVKTISCDLDFDFKTTPSCSEKRDGTIQVLMSSISGGTTPFKFKLEELAIESVGGSFLDLKPGKYTTTLKDSRGCVVSKQTTVPEKDCLPKDISFNPYYGEVAMLNTHLDDIIRIQILNRSGVVIFEKNVASVEELTWKGETTSGETVRSGTYVCIFVNSKGERSTIQIRVLQ